MTHDVRGHFPYHEYEHPTDHAHAAPAVPSLTVERLTKTLRTHEPQIGGYCDSGIYQDCSNDNCMWTLFGRTDVDWATFHAPLFLAALTETEPRP